MIGLRGLAGGGGLIRNEKGDWVKGYAIAIEIGRASCRERVCSTV